MSATRVFLKADDHHPGLGLDKSEGLQHEMQRAIFPKAPSARTDDRKSAAHDKTERLPFPHPINVEGIWSRHDSFPIKRASF